MLWKDEDVIDFVNWYIKLHKLNFRYELENQNILDSFKNGDNYQDWWIENSKINKLVGKISNKHVVTNGKAAFYATILPDLKAAALNCGWALGLHGSLANDMDLMAMPWTENATSVEEMIQALSDCFTDNPFKNEHIVPHYDKPNNRVVYTISIWSDFYLDINVIKAFNLI